MNTPENKVKNKIQKHKKATDGLKQKAKETVNARAMTFMYFLSSSVLAVGTYVVVYRSTRLRDQAAWLTVLVGMATYLVAQFARVMLMALFMVAPPAAAASPDGSDEKALDWVRIVLVAVFSLGEAVAMHLASTKIASKRSVSTMAPRLRSAAVGFGYALAETLFLRVPYFWMHARSVDWDTSSLCVALEAGAALAKWASVSVLCAQCVPPLLSALSGSAAKLARVNKLSAAALVAALVVPEATNAVVAHFVGPSAFIDLVVQVLVAAFAAWAASSTRSTHATPAQ